MVDVLIAKTDRRDPRLRIRITEHRSKGWAPNKYEKIIASKDFNHMALLLFDLDSMGYPIERAFAEFKRLRSDPELFFLK